MAGTERGLTTRDTVLLIALAAGDRVEGRTTMQKLAYFTGLALEVSLAHRPHYYGPYSGRVEDALNLAVVAGDLTEAVERSPDWRGGPDMRKYIYELTDGGKAKAQSLADEHSDEWERIERAVAAIRTVVPDFNQKTLSAAAKTYLIVCDSGDDAVSEDEVPQLAEQLGWHLEPEQVKKTIGILEHLELLDVEAPKSQS